MRVPGLLLTALTLLWSHPAAAAWYEAKSRHFIIYSEQRPDELQRYAEDLERFDKAVRILRTIDDPP
jgi:hypothetical protein